MSRFARLIILSQVSFWLFLVVCFLLMPHFLFAAHEGGISNYGAYTRTSVPYTLAFGLCGLLLLRAAELLPKTTPHHRGLRRLLYAIGALNLLVLESTYMYQVNGWLDAIHVYAGVILFLLELVAGIWLWRVYVRDVLQWVFLCLQVGGFVLLTLNYLGLIYILFIAEGIAGLGFSVLLVRAVSSTTTASPNGTSP